MLPEAACDLYLKNAEASDFQDRGHSFSLYGPPSRQITYIDEALAAADVLGMNDSMTDVNIFLRNVGVQDFWDFQNRILVVANIFRNTLNLKGIFCCVLLVERVYIFVKLADFFFQLFHPLFGRFQFQFEFVVELEGCVWWIFDSS